MWVFRLSIRKIDRTEIKEQELYDTLKNNLQTHNVELNSNQIFLSNNSFGRLTFKRVSSNEFKVKGDYKPLSFVILILLFFLGFIPSLLFQIFSWYIYGFILAMLGNIFIWYFFQKTMTRDIIQLFNLIEPWSIDTKFRIEF